MVIRMQQDQEEDEAHAELTEFPGLRYEPEMGLDEENDDQTKENLIVLGDGDPPVISKILKPLTEAI
jgi:hypothetical protein